jgi:hypothetical protein
MSKMTLAQQLKHQREQNDIKAKEKADKEKADKEKADKEAKAKEELNNSTMSNKSSRSKKSKKADERMDLPDVGSNRLNTIKETENDDEVPEEKKVSDIPDISMDESVDLSRIEDE